DDGNVANVAAAGTTALHFTYNNAGRLLERTETGAGANLTPETRQYDSTDGFLTGEQVPGGSLSAFEYSGQGELLGRVAQVAGASSSHLTTLTYTARGELVTTMPDQFVMPGQRGTPPPAYADGVLVQVPQSGGTTNWDSAMGVPLGTGTQSSGTGVSFDAAGRLVSESSYSESTTLGGATSVTHTQTTRTYDAENHLLSTQYVFDGNTYDAALIEYAWGPSGHPLRIGSAQNIQRTAGNWTPPTAAQVQYDTLHWDGSQLLFETNPAGQVDAINVGTLGAILPLDPGYNGLTFWDRQSDGSVAFCHNATGAAGGGRLLPYTLTMHLPPKLVSGTADINPCISPNTAVRMPKSVEWWASPGLTGTVPVPAYVGTGGVLGMPRTDGIDDGLDVIQGVRSYDAQAGIWTSPDAYAGTVNDPATQKSYMWNNNNPISYSDPSGYCTDPSAGQKPNGCMGGVNWITMGSFGKIMNGIVQAAAGSVVPVGVVADLARAVGVQALGESTFAVIGRFEAGYITAARSLSARYFDMGEEWDKLGADVAWKEFNVPFLRGIVQDKLSVFIVGKQDPGSILDDEVNWLLAHGYKYANDAKTALVPDSGSAGGGGTSEFYDANTGQPL
ncbi:MAG: RHS repeat-associated core domain-containing protein, partial [Vulcanimicrobiaceae bacterium]